MILAINSSTAQYSVALMTLQGVIIAEYMMIPKGRTFTGFIPAIDMLFESSGLDIKSLNVVSVTTGPGSFTGLRTGLSAAKGIAYSMDIPLIGVSGTEALASAVAYTKYPVCAMVTSRKGEAFYAFFQRGEKREFERQSDDKSMMIKDIGAIIQETTIIVGNDFEKQERLIREAENDKIIYARQDHWNLRASLVGILGLRRFHNNDFDDTRDLVPNYLQDPDIRPSKPKLQ